MHIPLQSNKYYTAPTNAAAAFLSSGNYGQSWVAVGPDPEVVAIVGVRGS